MTKKEQEQFNDLEKRISLLERELITQLLQPKQPYYNPNISQTQLNTCPACRQSYSYGSIHNCPMIYSGGGTAVSSLGSMNAKPNTPNSIPTALSGLAQNKNTPISCFNCGCHTFRRDVAQLGIFCDRCGHIQPNP